MFEVVIGIVIDQHAIVEDAVDRVEPRDELDQFALTQGVLLAAHLRIDIAQSGGVLGQRNDRDRAAIQARRFVELALGGPHLAQACQRAIVTRIGRERGLVLSGSLIELTEQEVVLGQARLGPGDSFGGLSGSDTVGNSSFQIGDGGGIVAREWSRGPSGGCMSTNRP